MSKSLKDHNFFGYDATVVADSENPFGDRLTTMVVTFPRIVLAEFNTHRMFSRNSASSRAIPFKKMIERVRKSPFIPLAFQKEHTGMQGTEYITDKAHIQSCVSKWIKASNYAMEIAENLDSFGVTKQICNRLLEPFLWHTVIISSTHFENFFELRCPQYYTVEGESFRSWNDLVDNLMRVRKANRDVVDAYDEADTLERLKRNRSQADIHIQPVAEAMWDALKASSPKKLKAGEWHIPFGDEINTGNHFFGFSVENYQDRVEELKRQISVATCARISYGNISPADADYQKDVDLYHRLCSSRHASPFEHVAQVMGPDSYMRNVKGKGTLVDGELLFNDSSEGWVGNFKGFVQQRYQEKI